MGFSDAVGTCLRNYVAFSGRARRSEYWWFVLAVALAGLVASLIDAALGFGGPRGGGGPINALVSLLTFLPLLAAGWRRLHDVGRSGWWLLAPPVAALLGAAAVVAVIELSSGVAGGTATALSAVPGVLGLAAGIFLLVLLVRRGEPGPNRFGPPPGATTDA